MYYTVCIMNVKLKWKDRQIFLSASAVLGVSQIPTTKMLNQNIFPTSYTMCKQNDIPVCLAWMSSYTLHQVKVLK